MGGYGVATLPAYQSVATSCSRLAAHDRAFRMILGPLAAAVREGAR